VDELQRKAPPTATEVAVPTTMAEVAAMEQKRPPKNTWPHRKPGTATRAAGGTTRGNTSHGRPWASAKTTTTTGATAQGTGLQAPLPVGGKLTTPARLNAVAAGMLVHIKDQLTDWRYLVDTDASFSLVPHCSEDPLASEPRLTGPNGLPIRC
jgi:hypothetical protein